MICVLFIVDLIVNFSSHLPVKVGGFLLRHETISKSFRMRIKELCKNRGIAQADLARRFGIHLVLLTKAALTVAPFLNGVTE